MPFTSMAVAGGTALAKVGAGTLLADAIAVTIAGTAIQVMGARESAKAERAMYKYNAAVATQEAAQKRRATQEEQQIRRERMRRVLKTQRALYAKGKIRMTGSPIETQLQAVEDMASDIATYAYEGETQARRFESRAGMERFRAKTARQAGRMGVAGALFGGVSQIGMMGLQYKLAKVKA